MTTLVQPELGDVRRVLLEFAAFDLLDDVDEPLVGAGREPRRRLRGRCRPGVNHLDPASREIAGISRRYRQAMRLGNRCNQGVEPGQPSPRAFAHDDEIGEHFRRGAIEVQHPVCEAPRRKTVKCRFQVAAPSSNGQASEPVANLGDVYHRRRKLTSDRARNPRTSGSGLARISSEMMFVSTITISAEFRRLAQQRPFRQF
jgi:hypothetical protein